MVNGFSQESAVVSLIPVILIFYLFEKKPALTEIGMSGSRPYQS